MQFTFKRDEEGRERIYVGDVCVAYMADGLINGTDGRSWSWRPISEMQDITCMHIQDAIERADEAGFWAPPESTDRRYDRLIRFTAEHGMWVAECTVDVPVADNAVLSVTVGGDES